MATIRKILNPQTFAGAFSPWTSGTSSYSGDENNAPDDAMRPAPAPANARSGVSLSPAFNPNTSAQPNVTRDIYQPQLRDISSRLQEAYTPPEVGVGGTIRHVLGALMSQRNPQLGSIISGDYQRQRQIAGLTKQYGLTEDAINQDRAQKAAELNQQNIGSEIRERGRANDIRQQVADTKETPPPKTPEEQAYATEIAKGTDPLAALEKVKNVINKQPKPPSEEDKALSDYLQAHNLPDSPANRDKARSVLKTRDRKATDPDIADLNKQLKQAQLVKAQEPTADEQRRADLARNMNENLDQLEEIANRRPDLFGPIAGRMTQAANVIGTSDPDKAKLKAIKEYLGMASVGAHAMRNAQHVATAADAVMNGFTNSPEAMKAAIGEARKSTGTFFADEKRRGNKATGGTAPVGGETAKDFGDAGGKPEGATGKLSDGTPVVVKGGRIVAQQ